MNIARAEIIEHIEDLNQICCDAINRRDFDPESPTWKNLWSRNFYAYVDGTVDISAVIDGGRHKVLRYMKQAFTLRPELWYRIFHSTTKLNDARNKAVSFSMVEITGNPPGVKRLAIIVTTWQLDSRSEKWLCISAQSMGGIDHTSDMLPAVF